MKNLGGLESITQLCMFWFRGLIRISMGTHLSQQTLFLDSADETSNVAVMVVRCR